MEEAIDDCLFHLDWGFMQDLTLWGIIDAQKKEESAQNYTGEAGQWPDLSEDCQRLSG